MMSTWKVLMGTDWIDYFSSPLSWNGEAKWNDFSDSFLTMTDIGGECWRRKWKWSRLWPWERRESFISAIFTSVMNSGKVASLALQQSMWVSVGMDLLQRPTEIEPTTWRNLEHGFAYQWPYIMTPHLIFMVKLILRLFLFSHIFEISSCQSQG